MELPDGKSFDSTRFKSVRFVRSVGNWLRRWITSLPTPKAMTSGIPTTFRLFARRATVERRLETMGDLGTSVVLTDCPLCGLPAELRESFKYHDTIRVVVLCPLNHATAASGDDFKWFDTFETP